MIEFKRAKVYDIPTGRIKRWASRDGRWAILQVLSNYGPRRNKFILVRAAKCGEVLVSYHRTRDGAAERARKLG
jgi:hypothetical protein